MVSVSSRRELRGSGVDYACRAAIGVRTQLVARCDRASGALAVRRCFFESGVFVRRLVALFEPVDHQSREGLASHDFEGVATPACPF